MPGTQTAGYFQYYNAADQATLIKGVDVFHSQYPINWTTCFNAGARFVYMKAGGNGFNFHTARYIRVQVNGSSTDGHAVFFELFAKDTGGTERATGAAVTGSVAPVAGAWANFTDGNTATSVDLGLGTQYLTVDMGASFNIRYIQLYQTSGVTFHHKLISYSTDNITYTPIFSTDAAGTGEYSEPSDGAIIVTADTSSYYGSDSQMLAANIKAARLAGLKVGFYWFRGTNYYDVTAQSWHNSTTDAITEATNFASLISAQLGGTDWGDIIPVVDFENSFGSINPAFTNDPAYNFLAQFQSTFMAITGKPVMMYTFQASVATLAATPNQLVHSTKGAIGNVMPIWLAATDTGVYPQPAFLAFGGFKNNLWNAWQYTPNGVGATYGMSSLTVDLDYVSSLSDILLSPVSPTTSSPVINDLSIYILDGKTESVLAVLNDRHYASCPYWNAQHFEQINGESTFSFTCAGDHRDSQYIKEANLAGFYDLDGNFQLFEISKIAEVHAETLEKQVTCEHQGIVELNDEFVNYQIYAEETAVAILTDVLTVQSFASRWQVGNVDSGNPVINTIVIDHASKMEAISNICTFFNLEIQFRITIANGKIVGRFVDLLNRRGNDVGKRFIYNRDMVSLEQNIDVTGLKTALYGFGKSQDNAGGKARVGFANVAYSSVISKPVNQTYVESSSYKAIYGRNNGTINRFGFFFSSSETDPVKLLNDTITALRQNNTPRLEFRMSAVDLEALSGFAYEKVRIGDTVRVIDQYVQPAVSFTTRIFEITRNYSQPEKTEIVLQNVTRRSITQDGVKLTKSQNLIANNLGVWQDSAYQGNGVSDHSFELLEPQSSQTVTNADGSWNVKRPLNTDIHTWYWGNTTAPSTNGTIDVSPGPRFVSALWNEIVEGVIAPPKVTISDFQAIVVGTSRRNPRQQCYLNQNTPFQGPYSLSAYVASYPGTTANGKARLEAWEVKLIGGVGHRIARIGIAEVDLLSSSITWYKWNRFGIPNIRGLSTATNFIEIVLTQSTLTPNLVYVADAVQFTPTDFPVTYQPDSVAWNYQNDLFGYFKRRTYIEVFPSSKMVTPAGTSFALNFKKKSTAYDSSGVTLQSKINDPLNEWTTTGQGLFTPRRNGHYLFNAAVRWGTNAAGGLVEHFLEIDGQNKVAFSYHNNIPIQTQTNGSATVYLKRGQKCKVIGFTANPTTINSSERYTFIRIKRLAF